MIDLGRPPLHSEGITLFADHADPLRFYYVPDVPRLRRRGDGRPELSLLKYRLDPGAHQALGGGLLSFSVDLSVPQERLAALRTRISRHFGLSGTPQLGPIVADAGACELVLIDRSSASPAATSGSPGSSDGSDDDLIVRMLGGASPSLFGDNATMFAVVLSPEGVALIEGALRGGSLPAGVVYALKVTGLRPALRATLRARWQQIYHYYENRFHGGQLLLAADIGATITKLIEQQDIQIEIDELVPPDQRTQVYEQAVQRVQTYVLEELFKPTLAKDPAPAAEPEGGLLATIGGVIKGLLGAFSFTYTLRQVDRAELKTFSYQLNVARAEQLTLSPQGTLTLLATLEDGQAAPLDVDGLITAVDPATSAELHFDIGALVDLAAEDIDHIEVFLSYGDRHQTITLDAASPRQTFVAWQRPELGLAVSYRYAVHFRVDSAGESGVVESLLQRTEARVIRINPCELYQRVVLRAVAQGVPFDRFPLVLCDVQIKTLDSGTAQLQTLELSAQDSEKIWRVRTPLGAALRTMARLRYVDTQGVQTERDWQDIEPGTLIVGNPFPDIMDVQILGSARFGVEVSRLVVELKADADPSRVATRILTREQPFATWSVPLSDPRNRDYQYRVTVHTMRSEVRLGRWLPGPPDGAKLVVGEGIARLREIQLMFIGRPLVELHLLGIKVRLQFEDAEAGLLAEQELWIQDTRLPLRWSYPVADTQRQHFSYQLTLVGMTGAQRTLDAVTTQELLVLVPLTAEHAMPAP